MPGISRKRTAQQSQVKTCCAETSDRKICEVTSGQTKTITVSIPKFEPPAKLCPNYPPILCDISIVFEKVTTKSDELISWRLVFEDIQHDKALVRLMIDSQMEEHIPLSTRDQRAKLLDQLLIAANKSPVRAYGYTWSLTSTGTPMKTLTLSRPSWQNEFFA